MVEQLKHDIDLYEFCFVNYKQGISKSECPLIYKRIKKLNEEDQNEIYDYIDLKNKKYIKNKYGEECTNEKNINQYELGLFEYDDLVFYKEGTLTFCFTKDEIPYIKDINPYTRVPLTPEFIEYIKETKSQPILSIKEYIDELDSSEGQEIDKEKMIMVEHMTAIDKILKQGLYKETDEYVSVGAYLELKDKYKDLLFKITDKKLDQTEIINFLYNNKGRKLAHNASYIYIVVKDAFMKEELASEDLSEERKSELTETISVYKKMVLGNESLEDLIKSYIMNGDSNENNVIEVKNIILANEEDITLNVLDRLMDKACEEDQYGFIPSIFAIEDSLDKVLIQKKKTFECFYNSELTSIYELFLKSMSFYFDKSNKIAIDTAINGGIDFFKVLYKYFPAVMGKKYMSYIMSTVFYKGNKNLRDELEKYFKIDTIDYLDKDYKNLLK
jgi:hypothetical protein